MKKKVSVLLVVLAVFFIAATSHAEEKIMIMCGAAFKMPMEEIVSGFMKQTGAEVDVSYAGIGTLFSQITLSKRGDIFIAPSPDIMKKADAKGLIIKDSIRNMGYFVPSINTKKGNPKSITSLKDMTRPGIRIALGNPETVYVGMLGAEIVDKALSPQEREQFRKNIVTYGADFSKLGALLVLGQVDAIIGFSYLSGWYPDKIETVKLGETDIQRIGVGQAARLPFSTNTALAEHFLDYLKTKESLDVFKKFHYFATFEDATAWIGAPKPIGGSYVLPGDWTGN
ncbi:MAG: molybdate ABC transporter substrate-binding protein [Syntrophaceae bacterium]|nr:molybdate ABC transporter substrate-binding protein [Syntrophaceae bacterium]